jgi:hypothetical protein
MPQFRGIPLGAIDGDSGPEPTMHLWIRSKVPWVSLDDGLPQHETHP